MNNKVLVYSTSQDHMAILIKGSLEAHGIKSLTLNQKDSAYTVFGQIEIYVSPEDEERAKEIIAEGEE